MSVKAVEAYYSKLSEQYSEMLQDLMDMEKELEDGIIEPERIDRIKDQIAPIKQNYERWSYMMFLLHQPNKKSKHKAYQQRNKKLLSTLDKNNSLDSVLEENKQAIKGIKG